MPTLTDLTHINIDKGLLMTNDELETRITRLETRCMALTALMHGFLPAIDPSQRRRVLTVYGQYCESTAKQMELDKVPQATVHMHLKELAAIYSGLEGALKLLEKQAEKKT